MVSRTAGDDIDSLKRSQLLICKPCLRKINVSLFYISANGVLNGLRLLMDLFQHKVLIAALLSSSCIPLDLHNVFLNLFTVDIVEMDLITGKLRNFKIADIINSSGLIQDRRNIRSDKASVLALSNDQRTVLAGCKQFARIVLENNTKCIRTADTEHCSGDCFQRSSGFLIVVIYQLHSHFCICLRIERITGTKKLRLQFLIILDNSIMNKYYGLIICTMRMGICLRRLSMSRPAGMTDAAGTRYG